MLVRRSYCDPHNFIYDTEYVCAMKIRNPISLRILAPALLAVILCSFTSVTVIAAPQAAAPQAPAPSPALQTPPPIGAPKIIAIIVKGAKTLNSDAIAILSGAKVGDFFTPALQSTMEDNLIQSGNFGYPDNRDNAVLVQSEEPNPPNGTCTVIIQVQENPTIKNVSITGSGPIKPDKILPLLQGLEPGKVFNEVQFNLDGNDIIRLYTHDGYVASISQDFSVDQQGILHIPIVVARISAIRIVGLHKTRKYVVTREMQAKVGSYFNLKVLAEDQRSLSNLGLFSQVLLGYNIADPGDIGVTVNVTEEHSGQITGGVGYSSLSQIIGYAELSDNNFRGSGERLSFRAETGGVSGRSSIELGFVEPYLDRHHTNLSVSVYDKATYLFSNSLTAALPAPTTSTNTNNYYSQQHVGSTVAVGRPFGKYFSGTLSLRAESISTDLLNLPSQDLQIIQNGPLETIGFDVSHDTRDLIFNPAAGVFQDIGLEVGHANLTAPNTTTPILNGVYGNATFVRLNVESNEYISLSGRRTLKDPTKDETVLALRTLLGATKGKQPFSEQFFIGGGDTLRGYRDDRFWGKYEFLSSIELRQPLAPRFTGVLFTDLGDAWGGPYSNVNINSFQQSGFHLHIGVGLGIRVITPLGALRLDYGFGDEGGRANFSVGSTF